MTKLALVGGGRMGEALVTGLVASGWASADELCVVEKLEARRDELAKLHPGLRIVDDVSGVPSPVDGAIVAVKPDDVPGACRALGEAGVTRALSIAAGVTLDTLEASFGSDVAVVRAMPNTPSLVGAGASAIAAGRHATDEDLAWADAVLSSVGVVVRVKESLLDAVTGLSGSGPAYVFLVAESMIEAGVLAGLPRDISETLAIQTLVGAGRLLEQSGQPAARLRADVTSPGGTTAAGLHALEEAGTRAAFLNAVRAATERARELGRS